MVVLLYILIKENIIKLRRYLYMKNFKINSIRETSYEDNSWWVNYSIDGINSIELKEGDTKEEVINEMLSRSYSQLICKRSFNECSDYLRDLIFKCYGTEEETLYISNEEITKEQIKKLQEEVLNLGLTDYVDFYEHDDFAVIIYGGIITEFKF